MARSVQWRRTCSDNVSWRQDQALSATIYILRETGPTGFLVKEEGESKKFRVFLGDPHTCTCPVYTKEKDLCKHICWLLLKKFRVSRQNPASWQLGLVEREVNEIIELRRNANRPQPRRPVYLPKASSAARAEQAGDGRPVIEQREIGEEDVCPICQEELLTKHMPVTYCKYGCGNSIHIKCMKVWADHQMNSGESVIKCPFCREDFGPFSLLKEEAKNTAPGSSAAPPARVVDRHYGLMCKRCRTSPIQGKCYKCASCFDFYLCQNCFNTTFHSEHSYVFRQKSNQRWRPVQRGSGTVLPSAVVNSLLNRDITDDDYDLLLQLDSEAANQGSDVPEHVVKSFPLEKVRDGSSLLSAGQQCCVCLRVYQVGQSVRRLPCRHKFHQDCIDNWLLHQRPTCPVDGQVVWDPIAAAMEEQERRHRNRERQAALLEPSTENQNILEIPGVGLARQETTGGNTSQRGTRRLAQGQRTRTNHNSFEMNFELSGTNYAIAQERLVSSDTSSNPSAKPPAQSHIQELIDRIPARIRQRVSRQSSIDATPSSFPSSNSAPDVSGLNLGIPDPVSSSPTVKRAQPGHIDRVPVAPSIPTSHSSPNVSGLNLGIPETSHKKNFSSPVIRRASTNHVLERVAAAVSIPANHQMFDTTELTLGRSEPASAPPLSRKPPAGQNPDSDSEAISRKARARTKVRDTRQTRSSSGNRGDRARSSSRDRSSTSQRRGSQDLFLGSGPPASRRSQPNTTTRVTRPLRTNDSQAQHMPDTGLELTGNALQGLSIGDLLN